MNKKLFLLLFASIGCMGWGQTALWEMPTILSDTSIVRHWRVHEYIVYSRQGAGPGTVSYHDNAAGTNKTVILPSGVVINDFCIANDTVFAGGSLESGTNKFGLIACFAINDIVNGAGTFHAHQFVYEMMDVGCCYTNDYQNLITGITRIAPFRDGGVTRVAFIADNIIVNRFNPDEVIYYRKGYGDIAYTASGWDSGEFHYDKYGVEEYSDIAVTPSKIVIVAQSNDSSLFRFQVFNKQKGYAKCLYSGYATKRYCYSDTRLLGYPMVTSLAGDTIVVAYHGISPTIAYCLSVKEFDVSGSLPVMTGSLEIPMSGPYNADWKVRDIRYNRLHNMLLVLHDVPSPITSNWGSYIYEIDLGNMYAGMYNSVFLHNHGTLYSLDIFNQDGFIVSVRDNPLGDLFIYNEAIHSPVTCGHSETVAKGKATSPTMSQLSRYQCSIQLNPLSVNHNLIFTVLEEPAYISCNRMLNMNNK